MGTGGCPGSVRSVIAIDTLVRLCPPPADPLPALDWPQAERALGTALPADYKQLVETYGDGIFDETIWLLVPDSAYDDCNLHTRTTERHEVLAALWEFEDKPAGLQEAGARVLPWAFEEGGFVSQCGSRFEVMPGVTF